MAKFGFIGMGNMGSAMLKGALKTFNKEDMIFSEKCGTKDIMGVRQVADNVECVK